MARPTAKEAILAVCRSHSVFRSVCRSHVDHCQADIGADVILLADATATTHSASVVVCRWLWMLFCSASGDSSWSVLRVCV